jgi:prepilin-type processing-associated H-X9-DG protein
MSGDDTGDEDIATTDANVDWTANDHNMTDAEIFGNDAAPEADQSGDAAAGVSKPTPSNPSAKAAASLAAPPTVAPPAGAEPAPTPEAAGAPASAPTPADANKPKRSADPYIKRGGNPKAPLAVGGFGSHHPGGANFSFADGSQRFLADGMSKTVFQRLGNRKDGKVVDYGY